jgi:hypothetical protein
MGHNREPDIIRKCFQRFRIGHVMAAMMVVVPTFLSVEARVIDCGDDGGALDADAADFHPPAGEFSAPSSTQAQTLRGLQGLYRRDGHCSLRRTTLYGVIRCIGVPGRAVAVRHSRRICARETAASRPG